MAKSKPPVNGKYIDPLVDFAFKKIFGSEPNKDLLIAFLNEVFNGRKHIVDLVYNKNEHPGDLSDEGGAIFDLLCTSDNGNKFLIEIQRGWQGYFKDRALFYTSRLISDQAPKGNRAEWKYNLTEVYMISLLEDFTVAVNDSTEYIHQVYLCNIITGKIFYDKLGFTFIELRKFVKRGEDLISELDKWLYILKNMSQMDKLPVYLKKPIFEKFFNIAAYSNLTREEKQMYDSSQKRRWDNKNVMDCAISEAVKENSEKERAKAYEEKLFMAREMIKDGLPLAQISKFTKLSIEELEKLNYTE